jgi:hypothetical protein
MAASVALRKMLLVFKNLELSHLKYSGRHEKLGGALSFV